MAHRPRGAAEARRRGRLRDALDLVVRTGSADTLEEHLKYLSEKGHPLVEDEDIEARAFTLDEIRKMLASDDIIDLKTVAGIALLQER